MEIEDIQRIYREYGATITDHANQRMMERDIESIEIRDAIFYGEIIENDFTAEPYPRYLILSCVRQGKPLHVVLGVTHDEIDVVTAYRPDPMRWDSTFRYRR